MQYRMHCQNLERRTTKNLLELDRLKIVRPHLLLVDESGFRPVEDRNGVVVSTENNNFAE